MRGECSREIAQQAGREHGENGAHVRNVGATREADVPRVREGPEEWIPSRVRRAECHVRCRAGKAGGSQHRQGVGS